MTKTVKLGRLEDGDQKASLTAGDAPGKEAAADAGRKGAWHGAFETR